MNPDEPCELFCPAQTDAPVLQAAITPPGFQDSVVFSGLTQPTAVRFASDGRVFVAEKSGLIKVFASLTAQTPTLFADLSTNVYNFWDRGLLGLTLDPNFPSSPYVYVLYSHDAPIAGTAPRWGTRGVLSDPCPTPPGPTTDGCVVSGRLSRLTASGDVMTGSEQVLIEDWCQQFPSHSIGSLFFGMDGALYVSGGEGANFDNPDWGQYGNVYSGDVVNPCGDPPSEGGALRSQDLRTNGDPVGLGGAILRVDPATGLGLPDNPFAGNADANARRIVASGLRNPFRFTIRPGTNDLWIGDVGWSTWEEIDRVANPTAGAPNFGWPCYEGASRQPSYQASNLPICTDLYGQPSAMTTPFYAYAHTDQVIPGEQCPNGSSSISGLAFDVPGGSYPASYEGALFFADYSRKCIWVMLAGANGLPDATKIKTFVANAAGPVDLQLGPGKDLFYVDLDGGTVRRVLYSSNAANLALNRPATASSSFDANFNASLSVDGDQTTRWSSEFSDPQWIYVDLGAPLSIGDVRLYWEYAYATAYKIQVSGDAINWTDVYTTTTGDGGFDDVAGLSATARYVRVHGTARGTPYGYSLWEFEVYALPPPIVASIDPATGPSAGGTVVTMTGTGFSAAPGTTTVKFGAVSATGVNCVSETSCVATSPPGVGTVDVTVTVGGLTSARSASDLFTYAGAVNLAVGRPSTASSTYGPGFEASRAVDGSLTTRWSSVFSDPQWIYVDLGATYTLGEVVLRWEFAYASGYRVQVSNDAIAWADIFSTITGDGGIDDLVALSGSGRYVRMFGTTRATAYGYSLWEFEVYGTLGPTVSAISPSSGPPSGGTIVSITGTGFSTASGATTVSFGTAPATGVSCGGSTNCVATSPAGSGTVHVTVTVNGLTSAPSTADQFTYTSNLPPTPTISTPSASLRWKVGDLILFSGSATDPEDGALPASALSWSLTLEHCPSNCHTHFLQTFSGVASGSFRAPDHDYPSHLALQLTATDSGGLTATTSVQLEPQTVSLTFQSVPTALQIVVASYGSATTPFARTVISGSTNSIGAQSPQTLSGQTYQFVSWSDAGGQSHDVTANASATYTATFVDISPPAISNVRSSGTTSSAATIGWTTNEPADSRVEYGLTTAYGLSTTLNPTLLTDHSQRLTGLRSGTTYHYRVISRDAAGNITVSSDRTFRTKNQ